jgi:nitroreductase
MGACWHCAPIFCKSNVRKALKIPDNVEPQALITLGFPDEAPNIPERKSLSEIVHLNEWGNSFDDLII